MTQILNTKSLQQRVDNIEYKYNAIFHVQRGRFTPNQLNKIDYHVNNLNILIDIQISIN